MNHRSFRRFHLIRAFCAVLLVVALGVPGVAQQGFGTPPQKLPQDTGALGLRQTLRRLQTTARLMETTAHPDDEDGPMLTLESRGKGVTALSLTLTRGEGGQNRTGSNLFDVLGILRTLEVLASDQHYGVEQRFTHVADFGFSKTAEETLQKWDGGTPALRDMVRVIREFRPDVIVSRFQGTPRDGHGQHQASGILTRQAFHDAADPTKFPEQIREGLQPWQAKKLYVGMFRRQENEPYTVALDTGVDDPQLGTSYARFALEGLKHQQSQGVGNWTVPPGPRLTYYKLVDSVLPMPAPGTHENDFFDGIDTSLPGLASRLGDEEKKVPFLRSALVEIQKDIAEAAKATEGNDPSQAAAPLLRALGILEPIYRRVAQHATDTGGGTPQRQWLSRPAQRDLMRALSDKKSQLERAIALALGFEVKAVLQLDKTPIDGDAVIAVPGARYKLAIAVANRGPRALRVIGVGSQGFLDGASRADQISSGSAIFTTLVKTLNPGERAEAIVPLTVPAAAAYSEPFERRDDPERDSIYRVAVLPKPWEKFGSLNTLPFPPPPFLVVAYETLDSPECRTSARDQHCAMASITVPVEVKYGSGGADVERCLAVGPAFSVLLEPATQVIASSHDGTTEVSVRVHSNLQGPAQASLSLQIPPGWRVEPSSVPLAFDGAADRTVTFKVFPSQLKEGTYELKAVLDFRGKKFTEGYTVVTRPDLGEFFYYQPAVQKMSAVDLKLPSALKVGYIMGAGDDIPTVLQQAGMDVHLITPQELANGDLSQYGTIVVGIRAYDVRDDVRANNKRLLDYVNNGGTLLVQYNTNITEFNAGHYAPYPLELSRDRVTVEEAPVDVLAHQDSVFHSPNQIAARDFDGWVQERGLYFADKWDEHYEPLLACHDPGEPPQKGGLLRARYGKGTYIYTGYAFFRQLPAGVPGAVRLFVNLVSAGHE